MKSSFSVFILFSLLIFSSARSQNYQLDQNKSSVVINGTSNLHDWEIEVQEYEASLVVDRHEEQIDKLSQLKFLAVAESLSSGKGGMDKNTYKALQTERFEQINFQQTAPEHLQNTSVGNYKARISGTLEIAGHKESVILDVNLAQEENNLWLRGTHKLNMEDYEVEPPKALFGTIKTGATVEIDFELFFTAKTL